MKSDTAAILADTGTDGVVVPQAQADKVWGTAARTLTANTNFNDPTAASIADAVWDEVATGHVDAGKAGQQLWTDVDAILADTDELQADDYPTSIAAVKCDTAAILTDTGTTLDGKIDTIDGIVDAILVDTGTTLQGELDGIQADTEDLQTQIGTAGAGLTVLATQSSVDTIDGNVDAILADTGTDGVVLKAAGLNADAVDEILDEVVEGTITLRQAVRLLLSTLTGKATGGGTTTHTFRDVGDTKARVTFTTDANGNRTASTIDGT